ncbi:MAG: hypothetical protein QOF60_1786 [Actinomycetota bacterium]|nr:hypothetical protein [Actinomycetota bacterium]
MNGDAQSIKRGLEALPLTSEQWETNHRPIVRENLARLAAMMELLRANSAVVERALDVGIGYGYTAAAIRATFPTATVIGLEHPSRTLLADPTWRGLCRTVEAHPLGADAYALPFKTGSFDLVVCGEILEHLAPTNVVSFLLELARTLRPGGTVVVTTPNLLSLTNRGMMALGRSPFELPIPTAGETYGHIREYSVGDVEALLSAAGFVDVAVRLVPRRRGGEDNSAFVRIVSSVERTLGALRPEFQGFIVAAAVRPLGR